MDEMWRTAADTRQNICCLINPGEIGQIDAMCAKHPETPVVVDHFARVGVSSLIRDGDVDGNDFLGSQLLGASAVSDWKGNYPIPAPLSGVAVVPEPSTLSLCALAAFALWPTSRKRV